MSTSSESKLATAKTILTTVGSIAATAVVVRSVANDLLPPELHDYIFSGIRTLFSSFSNTLTMVIDEFDGLGSNEIYEAAETYLGAKAAPSASRLKISRPEKEKHLSITMEKDQQIVDLYEGQKLRWTWICIKSETKEFYNPRDMNSTLKSEVRSFELTFHRKNKDMVINSYLTHVVEVAKTVKHEKKTIKIFTIDPDMCSLSDMWIPVTFDHPATFGTLAMNSDQKWTVMKDLEKFVGRKEYYRKVGKAWKRGYLLYGPPGTGKSSLIAAMANYLNFDVYDLELSEVRRNSDLRRLLVATGNKSILVVEDIDCTIDLQEKLGSRENSKTVSSHHGEEESKVTLSGLLNFVDGLWSSCGDERIIIFTTNHVEKLDPALLRPGRMDVHINLSYCTPCGFKLLASNYLGVKEHALFGEIEDLIRTARATPAEVAEELLKSDGDHGVALQGLIEFLHMKVKRNEEIVEKPKADQLSDCKREIVEQVEIKENGETN